MEAFLRYWLRWPSIEVFMNSSWAWPSAEALHFIGLCLLVGTVGLFDLRMLGVARGVPLVALKRLVPWGVFGFGLCVVTGLAFTLGIGANLPGDHAYDVIAMNPYLQWKLIFLALAGVNLLGFYVTGAARAVDALGPDDSAPMLAQVFAGASLVLWFGIIVLGRLIPQGL
jgi:hypothetical protein